MTKDKVQARRSELLHGYASRIARGKNPCRSCIWFWESEDGCLSPLIDKLPPHREAEACEAGIYALLNGEVKE